MTLAPSTRYIKYDPVTLTTVFIVPFPLFDTEDLRVVVGGLATDLFSVTATFVGGKSVDATITLVTAVTGVSVEIYGNRVPSRTNQYLGNSPDLASNLQNDIDAVIAVQQEQRRDNLRSVKLSAALDAQPEIQEVTPGASLVFDADGNIVAGPNAVDIAGAQAAANAAILAAGLIGAAALQYPSAALLAASVTVGSTVIVAGVPLVFSAGGEFSDLNGRTFRPATHVTPRLYGAVGYEKLTFGPARLASEWELRDRWNYADDGPAIQAAWIAASKYKIPCFMEGLEYSCSGTVTTRANLTVIADGAIMFMKDWPPTGGFVNNVVPGLPLERIQSNIYVHGLYLDAHRLPHGDVFSMADDATGNRLVGNTDFTNAAWIKGGCSVTGNVALAPDGASSADTIFEDSSNGNHFLQQTNTGTGVFIPGEKEAHTTSVFVRARGRSKVQIGLSGTAFGNTLTTSTIDLVTGEVTASSSFHLTADTRYIGGGWWHIVVTRRYTVTGTVISYIYPCDAAGNRSYLGTNQAAVDVWNAYASPQVGGNSNLLGFARGASHVRVTDCVARRMRSGGLGGGGTGGGAFGIEQGGNDIEFNGCVAEDCYRGFRVAGLTGDHPDDGMASRQAVGIRLINFTARRCDAGFFAHTIGDDTSDSISDLSVMGCIVENPVFEDCGHAAWRQFVFADGSILPQKSGVIVLAGALNVHFRGVITVRFSAAYPNSFTDWLGRTGWPASGTNFIGSDANGVTPYVGAVIWGWGRNCTFESIQIDGNVDALWYCGRAVSLGESASVAPTNGTNGSVQQIVIEDARYVRPGLMRYIYDGMPAMDNTKFGARINFLATSGSPTAGIVNNASTLGNLLVQIFNNAGAVERGTALEWIAAGNVRPSVPASQHNKGSMDWGGGFSSSGTKPGLSYDAVAGILRSSQDAATAKFHLALYNTNGLVGSVQTNGSATVFVTSSDGRLKTDLQDFDAFEVINAIRVYDGEWINGGRGHFVIAQELEKVFPSAVIVGDSEQEWESKAGTGEQTPWGVDYSKIVPDLIRAVQQLEARLALVENPKR